MDARDGYEQIVLSCLRKRRYDSAEAAGRTAARRRQAGAPPLRVYACPACQGYHLTRLGLADLAARASGPAPCPAAPEPLSPAQPSKRPV